MDICLHTNLQLTEKYIGGTERFLLSFAKELNNLGFNSFIVCSSFIKKSTIEGVVIYGTVPEEYHNKAKKYKTLSSDFINNEIFKGRSVEDALIELSHYTEKQLNNFDADIFHLNSFISAAYLDPSKRKYIIYNHENDKELDSRYGNNFFNQFSNLVRRQNSQLHKQRLFVPSQYYSSFFEKSFNCKIQTIKLGVNLIDFSYIKKENYLKENLMGEQLDSYLFLLPSRFKIEQKGHDIALKAMTIVRDRGIKFKLLITGVKPNELDKVQEFNSYAKELKIHQHIVISSYTDMNIAYQNVDCVISPERYCSYGLSVSESLSLGIPTIMSNIPTYQEIGKSYKHAYFFENERHQDLADIIITLVQNQAFERDRQNAILFRINNDIRDCAKIFSIIYMSA